MAKVKEIPIGKIQVGGHALRAGVENEDLDELAASIRRIGVLVPLIVRSEGDEYYLIAGHRRYTAALRIGLAAVPCLIRDSAPAESSEIAFAENLFRQDLSPVETASGLKDILDQGVMDLGELARAVHRSTEWIHRMVALLDWPADVLEAVHAGWLSVSAASNLALVTDDIYRDFLLRNAHDNGATARTTAAWLQAFRSLQPAAEAVCAEPLPPGTATTPAVPQAPCICCSQVFRTDQLCHIPVCTGCVNVIRGVGTGGRG